MKPPHPLRAVLFDWDGTLVDTAEASFRCYVRMFAEFGIPFDREAYAKTYSPNWYHTFELVGLAPHCWPRADSLWLSYFASEPTSLLPATLPALDALRSRGVRRGIVTSGGRDRVSRELVAHGVQEHFEHVVFGDETERRKPHPDPLHLCLSRLAVPPEHAAYIGDSPEDVLMARAAGVYAVAVRGAYPNVAALESAGANAIADDVQEAVAMLCGAT
ncbi:MAG TPA: HAD family hydrolase [Thermoanaerobaculia bacterium]|nr:HAD family hydrolase [Thermoanaerobaculia bacterium]